MTRFATIGSNFVTDSFLEAAQGVEGFQLEGVYSRTRARAAGRIAGAGREYPPTREKGAGREQSPPRVSGMVQKMPDEAEFCLPCPKRYVIIFTAGNDKKLTICVEPDFQVSLNQMEEETWLRKSF